MKKIVRGNLGRQKKQRKTTKEMAGGYGGRFEKVSRYKMMEEAW